MALFRSVLKLRLDEQRELHVVLEDRNPRVVFTLNEQISENFKERTTFILSRTAAQRLIMFIAGIRSLEEDATDEDHLE